MTDQNHKPAVVLPVNKKRDEAYFVQLGNDQLAFFACRLHDHYVECLFDDESQKFNLHEVACSLTEASIALRVLARRLIGTNPSYAKSQVDHMQMVRYGLVKPAGGNLQ
ncbi:hypothetical protein ACIPI6_31570 [Pseudomonas protegens]|uniref:hypothetical protein n=1 Tax=Pseudomonas protegens TaxID=380021 RepID=UPI0038255803